MLMVAVMVVGALVTASLVFASSWTLTDSMGEARIGHTGTLLDNGEVLVVGGDFGNFFTHRDSAELYDPITETWSFTGSMALPRAYGTATLLTNGKVLLAAGQPSVFDTASPFGNLPAHTNLSEIYDPLTGTWSSAGAMAKRRHLHAATRLSAAHGSKVLVSGGYDGNSPAGVGFSANLYDPVTNSWAVTGSLNTGRQRHASTLLQDGRVMVVGGRNSAPGFGHGELNSVELFDPDTETWSFGASMPGADRDLTATTLNDGRVLAVMLTSGPFLYDPILDTWSSTGPIGTRRIHHQAVLLADGRVLVVGGHSGAVHGTPSTEIYDPATDTWSSEPDMNVGRLEPTATLLDDGRVLAAGGNVGVGGVVVVLASAELYEGLQPDTLEQVVEDCQEIVDDNPGSPLADKMEDVCAKAQAALDATTKDPPDNQAAMGSIEGAVGDLEAAVKDGLLDAAVGIDFMDRLAAIAEQMAQDAIDEAIAQGGDPGAIADAQSALADGDALRTSEAFKDAVAKYKDALSKAEGA